MNRHAPATRQCAASLSLRRGLAGLGLVLLAVPAAAHPPQGRLNPEERQRLRQELREHRDDYRQGYAGGRAYGPVAPMPPQAYPTPVNQGYRPGRMSEEDRRALREQLRDQKAQQNGLRAYPADATAFSPNGR